MKKIIITEKNYKQRIDKFLKQEVFLNMEITRGEIIREIKNGEIKVSGKNTKPSYVLKVGDEISVNARKEKEKLILNKNIRVGIIYQDENIIIINKPAGLKVHPSNFSENNTLANFLIAKFPEIKNVNDGSAGADLRPGIVHRLDKDTSGIMVIARNQKSFDELKKLFKERKITKKYLAITYGKLENKEGVIKALIARAGNYKKQVIAGRKTKTKIREAVTEYKVLKESEYYSLVEVRPQTGRMHQIRIHLFSIGYPIVGDKLYKLKSKVQPFLNPRLNLEIKRQLLHAEKLEFKLWNKKYSFQADLPKDFSDFIESIK